MPAGGRPEVLHLQVRDTLSPMPTSRRRHTLTKTDEVAEALDNAAQRWPAERNARTKLLLRLIAEGDRALRGADRRRTPLIAVSALARTSGVLTGTYPDGYLEELREGWPA